MRNLKVSPLCLVGFFTCVNSSCDVSCFLPTTDENIDGEAFLELDDEELKALGQKIGVIKKLRRLKDSVSVFPFTKSSPSCLPLKWYGYLL